MTWLFARVSGWVVLIAAWWRVVANGQRPTILMAVIPLAVAFFTSSITLLWINHNRGIYDRKGARRAVPVVEPAYQEDRIGRPLRLDRAGLSGAREITISIDERGTKVYERVS